MIWFWNSYSDHWTIRILLVIVDRRHWTMNELFWPWRHAIYRWVTWLNSVMNSRRAHWNRPKFWRFAPTFAVHLTICIPKCICYMVTWNRTMSSSKTHSSNANCATLALVCLWMPTATSIWRKIPRHITLEPTSIRHPKYSMRRQMTLATNVMCSASVWLFSNA